MIYGVVLDGDRWVRVDRGFNEVPFNASAHGTWSGMKTVTDGDDVLVEIPTTWVKTEVLQDGPYVGRTCWWTADEPAEGLHVHPAFMKVDGTVGVLRIGAYLASRGVDGTPVSVDGGADVVHYWTSVAYEDLQTTARRKIGWRAYSIYDHHLLARLMLTEFGTMNVQSLVDWDGSSRIAYRGVHDPFGLPNTAVWLNGLTTDEDAYRLDVEPVVLNGGVPIPNARGYIVSFYTGVWGGVDLGDLFIAREVGERSGDGVGNYQYVFPRRAFVSCWGRATCLGPMYLYGFGVTHACRFICWRFCAVV